MGHWRIEKAATEHSGMAHVLAAVTADGLYDDGYFHYFPSFNQPTWWNAARFPVSELEWIRKSCTFAGRGT